MGGQAAADLVSPDKDPKQIVAEGYDRVAERYAELEAADSPWPRLRRLQEVLSRLPDTSDVLDIGCGNGIPALQAIAERHRATGVDISFRQVELARRNVSGARIIHGDVMSLELPAESFDAVVAFYVVEHLPRHEHSELFRRVWGWLRGSGYLLFTVETGDQPDVVGDWLGVPMFFSEFDAGRTLELVEDAGFEIVRHATESQAEGESVVTYLWVLAHKPPARASLT